MLLMHGIVPHESPDQGQVANSVRFESHGLRQLSSKGLESCVHKWHASRVQSLTLTCGKRGVPSAGQQNLHGLLLPRRNYHRNSNYWSHPLPVSHANTIVAAALQCQGQTLPPAHRVMQPVFQHAVSADVHVVPAQQLQPPRKGP